MRTLSESDSVRASAHPSNSSSIFARTGLSVGPAHPPITLLGVPFDNVTTLEVLDLIERMVISKRPHYLATANVDFLVQASRDLELRRILFDADLVLCDGTPLLWASRWLGNPLRERVAGSDLVPLLLETAALKGYRVYFLGGSPRSTSEAVHKLQVRYPGLMVSGHYSPPFQDLLQMDHAEIRKRIREAQPDLLFVAFGCPKQEKWIAMHYRSLGVPVSIGVGATIDFLSGRMARAPKWMQRTGMEWIFRLLQEPRRLAGRYFKDCYLFAILILLQWCRTRRHWRRRPSICEAPVLAKNLEFQELHFPDWLDAHAVLQRASLWDAHLTQSTHSLLHLANVKFIDSTGISLLIKFRKNASQQNRRVIFVSPSPAIRRSLEAMQLLRFFEFAPSQTEAVAMLKEEVPVPACLESNVPLEDSVLKWRGEITAANAEEVWEETQSYLHSTDARPRLQISLAAVNFIDSTGVGLMVRAKKEAAKSGATLKFTGLQADLRSVLRLAKLENYLLDAGSSSDL